MRGEGRREACVTCSTQQNNNIKIIILRITMNTRLLYIFCGGVLITVAIMMLQIRSNNNNCSEIINKHINNTLHSSSSFPSSPSSHSLPLSSSSKFEIDACDVVIVVLTGSNYHQTRLKDIQNTYMKYLF